MPDFVLGSGKTKMKKTQCLPVPIKSDSSRGRCAGVGRELQLSCLVGIKEDFAEKIGL